MPATGATDSHGRWEPGVGFEPNGLLQLEPATASTKGLRGREQLRCPYFSKNLLNTFEVFLNEAWIRFALSGYPPAKKMPGVILLELRRPMTSPDDSKDRDRSESPTGNPLLNGDIHDTPDATLGGYVREHSRPPAFEGADGEPYTVSIEVEKTGDLRAPYEGYLIFPRWASTGLGVVGHVETPTLLRGTNRDDVAGRLGKLPLVQVKFLLDQALDQAGSDDSPDDPISPTPEG